MTKDPKKHGEPHVNFYPPLESQKDLQLAEQWSRLHNEVMDELVIKAQQHPEPDSKLLKGFLEIANFMLKNTCGVGSNFRLAECHLAEIDKDTIRKYYTLVLATLAYHFGQLMPHRQELVWSQILTLCGDEGTCRELACELEGCRDHQDGDFSPVRAGRRMWERASALLGVKHAEDNATARIYYQTAPGQDLVHLVEQALDEGWFRHR